MPALRDGTLHLQLAEVLFSHQLVVCAAEQAQVVERVRATPGPGLPMVDLKESSGRAADAVVTDIATAKSIPLDELP